MIIYLEKIFKKDVENLADPCEKIPEVEDKHFLPMEDRKKEGISDDSWEIGYDEVPQNESLEFLGDTSIAASSFWENGPTFLRENVEFWPVRSVVKNEKLEGKIEPEGEHVVWQVSFEQTDVADALLEASGKFSKVVNSAAYLLKGKAMLGGEKGGEGASFGPEVDETLSQFRLTGFSHLVHCL